MQNIHHRLLRIMSAGLMVWWAGLAVPLHGQLFQVAEQMADQIREGAGGFFVLTDRDAEVRATLDGAFIPFRPGASFPLDTLGQFNFRAGGGPVTFFLQAGRRRDTLTTTGTLSVFNGPDTIRWFVRSGGLLTLADGLAAIDCPPPAQATFYRDRTAYLRERTTDPGDAALAMIVLPADAPESLELVIGEASFELSPGNRFFLEEQEEAGVFSWQKFGDEGAAPKLTGDFLQVWRRYAAFQSDAWLDQSLREVRKELMANPLLPEEVKALVPAATETVADLVPREKTGLEPWQLRLYQTKEAYRVDRDPGDLLQVQPAAIATPLTELAVQSRAAYMHKGGFGISQTAVLEGLAKFIEDRAQEELNITFLDRMQRYLERDPVLSELFPETLQLFSQFELSNYRVLLDNLKVVFQADLENLGLNIYKVLEVQAGRDYDYSADVYFTALLFKLINMIYLEVPADTLLINAYLSLDEQVNRLDDRYYRLAAATLRGTPQQQAFSQRATGIYDELNGAADSLYVSLGDLREIAGAYEEKGGPSLAGPVRLDVIRQNLSDLDSRTLDNRRRWTHLRASWRMELNGGPTPRDLLDSASLDNYQLYFSGISKDTLGMISRGLERLESREMDLVIDRQLELTAQSEAYIKEMEVLVTARVRAGQMDMQRRMYEAAAHYLLLREAFRTTLEHWQPFVSWETDKDLLAIRFLYAALCREAGVYESFISDFQAIVVPEVRAGLENTALKLEQDLDEYLPLLKKHLAGLQARYNWPAGPAPAALTRMTRDILNISGALDALLEEGRVSFSNDLEYYAREYSWEAQRVDWQNPLIQALDSIDVKKALEVQEALSGLRTAGQTVGRVEKRLVELRNAGRQLQLDWKAWMQKEEDKSTRKVMTNLLQNRQKFELLSTVLEVSVHLIKALEADPHRVGPASGKWLRSEELDHIFRDTLTRSLYLGMLYQRIAAIETIEEIDPEKMAVLSVQLLEVVDALGSLERKRQLLAEDENALGPEDMAEIIDGAFTFVAMGLDLLERPGADNQGLETAQVLLRQTGGLYKNLVRRNYNYAIVNAGSLISTFMSGSGDQQLNVEANAIRQKLLKYGSFVAAVSRARDADDVNAALKDAALPAGSSRIKRLNRSNVAINAYLGMGLGKESFDDLATFSSWQANLATPIGLTFSKKFGSSGFWSRGSFSLFLPVLDLGPIVTFDLNQGSSRATYQLEFGDFLAPGAMVMYNFPRSPFTMGFGAQRTSRIRRIGADALETEDPAIRLTFVSLIDVPIFNIFTREFKKPKK